MTSETWKKNWSLPQFEIRKEQIDILDEIEFAIDNGFRNIVLEAGTGIGKSAIATTLANTYDKTYLLTMTTQLQQQYLDDFKNLTIMKGRNKYTCLDKKWNIGERLYKLLRLNALSQLIDYLNKQEDDLSMEILGNLKNLIEMGQGVEYYYTNFPLDLFKETINNLKSLNKQTSIDLDWIIQEFNDLIRNTSCKPCNHRGGTTCNDCLYKEALEEAKASKILITNYDYLYYAGNYAHQFGARELLICDESHNLEHKIMNLVGTELPRSTIQEILGKDLFEDIIENKTTLENLKTTKYWINKLTEYQKTCESQLEWLKERKNNMSEIDYYDRTEPYTNLKKRCKNLIKHLEDETTRWIIKVPTKKNILDYKPHLSVDFKPLTVENYSDVITRFGLVRLFMTGTLGNHEEFCRWIGLDPRETYYIYKKSPFPVENRPIIRDYAGSMSGKINDVPNWQNKRALAKIRTILKRNQTKGVIHTSSNEQAWFIKNNIRDKRLRVIYGKHRNKELEDFIETDSPRVLVGAGIKDGVDFKGDLCRFQIIFKMPFPVLQGQNLIRKNLDPAWYNYQTIMPLMQAYGRGVRDMEDYCITYILDKDFETLLRYYEDYFNEYFLEAIE